MKRDDTKGKSGQMRITAPVGSLAAVAVVFCAPVVLFSQDVSNVTLPNTTITSGGYSYQANNSITANSFVIDSGARVTLQAGSTITLNPGFQALTGSSFIASVNPIFRPGSPLTTSAATNIAQDPTFTVNVLPQSGGSIAGGDIYLQAYGSNGSFHQCPINFAVSPSQLTMTDSGQEMPVPSGSTSVITNSTGECYITGSSAIGWTTTVSANSNGASLSLDITFPIAPSVQYPFTYVITEETYDSNGVLSPLEYLGTIAVSVGQPTLILTTAPSLVVAPENHYTQFQANLVGVNGFTSSTQITVANEPYSQTTIYLPDGTTYSPSGTDSYGNQTYSFPVQVNPLVNTGTQIIPWEIMSASYTVPGANSPQGLLVNITENQPSTIRQTLLNSVCPLDPIADELEAGNDCWAAASPR